MMYGLLCLLALPHSGSGEVHRLAGFEYSGLSACWGCPDCLSLGLTRRRLDSPRACGAVNFTRTALCGFTCKH